MDKPIRSVLGAGRQPLDSFLARSLVFLDGIEKWLQGFFEMTQKRQRDAGLHNDDPGGQ
jgi:hypothetical protein